MSLGWSQFLSKQKQLPRLSPFEGGYEICHTKFYLYLNNITFRGPHSSIFAVPVSPKHRIPYFKLLFQRDVCSVCCLAKLLSYQHLYTYCHCVIWLPKFKPVTFHAWGKQIASNKNPSYLANYLNGIRLMPLILYFFNTWWVPLLFSPKFLHFDRGLINVLQFKNNDKPHLFNYRPILT